MRILPLIMLLILNQSAYASAKKVGKSTPVKIKDGKVIKPEDCPPEGLPAPATAKTVEQLKDAVDKLTFSPTFCEALNSCYSSTSNKDCTRAESSLRKIKSEMTNNKAGTCNLTNEEMAVISYYSVSGYGCINKFLWGLSPDKTKVQVLVETMNSGLRKLPAYKGLVRRGSDLPPHKKALHVKGAVVTYEAFTSTSTGRGFTASNLFYIFSATGRPIMGFSQLRSESEVLFPSNTEFKILDIIKKDGKDIHIMKEVTNESPKIQKAEEKRILALVAQRAIESKSPYENDNDMYDCPLNPGTNIPKSFPQIKIPALYEIRPETPGVSK